MRNGWWKPIYKYNLDLKMTYENEWELKPDYKYKWDIFLDYDMKNHDIHENKNVCPEFNGEKMHEQNESRKSLIYQGFSVIETDFWYRFDTKQNNKKRQECNWFLPLFYKFCPFVLTNMPKKGYNINVGVSQP